MPRRNRKSYRIKKSIIYKEADGLIYILDVERNKLRTLNETASFIWKTLLKEHTIVEVMELLKKNYEAPEKILRKDCRSFIRKYEGLGFLVSRQKKSTK